MASFPEAAWMEAYRARVNADPEMEVIGGWFTASLSFTFGETRYVVRVERGKIADINAAPRIDSRVVLRLPRADGGLAEVRQSRSARAVSRLLRDADARSGVRARRRRPRRHAERASAAAHDEPHARLRGMMPNFEPIVGRYVPVIARNASLRVFVEEAGQGVPLICLHTAGADSRQWRHVLNDAEITRRFRVIAFDLPYHGRSTPPGSTGGCRKYRLTTQGYLDIIRAVWKTLELERPVVMGCSMGGAIIAQGRGRVSERADRHRRAGGDCVCARPLQRLPAPPGDPRRRALRELHLRASARRRAPRSRSARTGGTTARAGPASTRATSTTTASTGTRARTSSGSTRKRCKVSLLTGEYDYSCTPAMTEAVAAGDSGRAHDDHEGHGAFPHDRELSGVPAVPAAGARLYGRLRLRDRLGPRATPPTVARASSAACALEASRVDGVVRNSEPKRLRWKHVERRDRSRDGAVARQDTHRPVLPRSSASTRSASPSPRPADTPIIGSPFCHCTISERGADAPPVLVELEPSAREELRRPVGRVHPADRLRHLLAVGGAGLLERVLQDPDVAVRRDAVLRHPRLAGALLELGR